jgi:hypothetical protein
MLTPDEHRIASALRDNPMGLGEVHAPEVVYASTGAMVWAALRATRHSGFAPSHPVSAIRRVSGAWVRVIAAVLVLTLCIILPANFRRSLTMTDSLILKWGTLKGWDLKSEAALAAAQKLDDLGPRSMSAMAQRDTAEEKQALCDLIDAIDGEIMNDWSGEVMTKDEAKKYVLEYRRS